ncbi:response regulator transcription factor [Xylophilus sp. GOD-11R]|uniref:response regulator transcription factor n=1 Tax=Xylophilus sp. GOD-11R TaxID=3089814 RepID=UPI00298D3AC5|nr:response regulator transcription factor [Xylophilus sp. GOD-11R]WPB55586.1 response regulator transcription factor [Xylophilus sp. GOD-11R]
MMPTTVLIVEDEPEFMRRFSNAVLNDSSLSLLGAVNTGQAGLSMLDLQPPDVLLVDLGLPDMNGVTLIEHVARHHPGCDVLVVTMFADDNHVVSSIEAGASGYLLKDASAERIVTSIHELRLGGAPISPGIARRVLERFRTRARAEAQEVTAGSDTVSDAGPDTRGEGSPLTPREGELLRMIAKGFTFETIGTLLDISPHTVVAHVKKIYRKLAVHSRSEAVYEAGQLGLL